MPDLLPTMTPDQKRRTLISAGMDPEEYDFDSYGSVFPRVKQQSPATQDSASLQITAKPSPLGSFGRQAAAGVVPSAAGLGLGALVTAGLVAAPFTGGGSLIPLIGGISAAMAGGYGAAKLQEKLLPDSVNQTLARDFEENPKSSMAGNVASSLLFLKPDPKSIVNAATGLKNRFITGGQSQLSAAQKGNLLNVGLGGGLGAASSAYDDISQDKDIDLGKLLISAAGNAIINNPNKLGQKAFRLTPNTYDVAGEAQTRAKMAGDTTTLRQDALNQRNAQDRANAAEAEARDLALLETVSKKYKGKVKSGNMTLRDAVFLTQEDAAIAQRKAAKAAGKKMEPSVKEELSEFGKQEASYDEMYSKYGDVLAQQEPTPKLKLQETTKLVDDELARQSEALKLEEFKTKSAEIEAQKLALQQRQADLAEATTSRVTPKPPATSEEVLGTTAALPPAKPTVAPEVKPVTGLTKEASELLTSTDAGGIPAFMTANLRKIAKDNNIKVTNETTPNEVIAELRTKLPRQQNVADPILTEEQRKTIISERDSLQKTAKDQGKSLEPTVGFRDAMHDLAAKRGVKLEYDNTIEGAGETLSRNDQIKVRKLLQDVTAKINPDKAGIDTWSHELIHPLITDMETGPSILGQKLAAKVKAVAQGSEELLTDLSGKEVISRLLDLRKESGGKKLYRDFAAFIKTKYGNPSLDDVKRLMANRLLNEVPYSELSGKVSGEAGAKAGSREGEEGNAGEAVRAQDSEQSLSKEQAAPKFDDMRRAAGATEKELANKPAVEAKDLKAAKFAGRKQEDSQTLTPEFKKWFGESKVVDSEGKPLRVHHTTNASILGNPKTKGKYDYEWIDKPEMNVFKAGHFGTANQASQHLVGGGIDSLEHSPTTYAVYLNIKNPKRVVDAQNNWPEQIALAKSEGYDGLVYRNDFEPDAPLGENVVNYEKNVDIRNAIIDKYNIEHGDLFAIYAKLEKVASKEDLKTFTEATGSTMFGKNVQWTSQRNKAIKAGQTADSYLPFYPEQIKSATGNSGAFDGSNPDIRMQQGENTLRDDRVFVTDFEKSLVSGDSPVAKLRVNKEGKLDSNEVLGQMSKFNPGEVQLLKDAGIEEYLKGKGKVTKEELANWVKENGPRVETLEYGQQGKVSAARSDYDEMTHNWFDRLMPEQQNYINKQIANRVVTEYSGELLDKNLNRFNDKGEREKLNQYLGLAYKIRTEPIDNTSPRATSAYNYVSPKDPTKFPVQRVDVVLPLKKMSYEQYRQWLKETNREGSNTTEAQHQAAYKEIQKRGMVEKQLWSPDNLHENVPNTVGWAAIQYETLPSGEKVAHIFEAQSAWGQAKRAFEVAYNEAIKAGKSVSEAQQAGMSAEGNRRGYTPEMDSALLKDYNRLIIKAAIDAAHKKGATKIAISDTDTAMTTQGHDIQRGHDPEQTVEIGGHSVTHRIGSSATKEIQVPSLKGWKIPNTGGAIATGKVTISAGSRNKVYVAGKTERGFADSWSMEGDSSKQGQAAWQAKLDELGYNTYAVDRSKWRPEQEGGMRFNYDPSVKIVDNKGNELTSMRFPTEEDAHAYAQNRQGLGLKKPSTYPKDWKGVREEMPYKLVKGDLHQVAEELTGSKGEAVEFGEHKNAMSGHLRRDNFGREIEGQYPREDLIFKNADGSPKTSITARAYDISFPAARRNAGEPFTMFGKRYQEGDLALPRQQAADNLTSEPRTVEEVKQQVAKEQPMKLAILDFMLGQADKAKKVDQQLGEALENFFARVSYYEGKYANTIQKVVTTAPKEVQERVGRYMMAIDAGKPAPYTLNAAEKSLHGEVQQYLKGVREDQNRIGVKVSGIREGNFNENYLPNIIDRDVINTLINKGNTPEAAALRATWNSHIVKESKGKLSLKEAAKITNDYIRAIGNEKLSGQLEFGAIRKAAGYGLPEALQEKDLATRLTRYGRRVAKDFSYFEELQNKPEVAAKLGLKDQKGKQILVEGIESSNYAHEDVKKAVKMVGDTGDNYHPITNTFNRVVTNALVGTLSGLRDVVSIPTHTIPYLNKLEDFGALVKAIPKIGEAWKKSLAAGARRENLDSLLYGESGNSGNYAVDALNKLAHGLRVLQGREFLEQGARAYTYAIGEELTKANIVRAKGGDKESLAWLKKFGNIVDTTDFSSPAGLSNLTAEDISKLSKGFVDRVQGGYDGRNLPLGIMEGPAAPFFALSRWSVEKANVIRKDVLEPLARGNVKPFLMYSLGSLVTGAVIEKLAEEVNGRRAADPTFNEAFKNSQATTDDKVGYAIKAMQLGSYAGILSDVVKAGWDVKEGKVPRGFSYPAADFIANTLGRNLSDMMQAIKEGEDPSKTIALFVEQVAKNSIQGVRIVNNQFINPEDTARSEKFRDKAVFETMTDQKQPTSFGTSARSNPYTDVDYKEFKRADTVEETIPALKKAIATALTKANGDPLKLKNELSNLRRNSFPTMPNPKTMPQKFLRFVLFLRETQGEEEASARVEEYLRMQRLNRAKSAAIPR
jgi:hypothetical protein